MPERQAVVTLHPLYSPDTFSFRSLTFASDDDYVDIGRSSKRETKNLVPAHYNAWFDSRVMSRDHARIGVNMAEKTVIIRDGGSMHGTWVNDRRIPVEQDVVVNSGDVLTFGADVTRGAETFPPLRVRCGCEWFDSNGDASKEDIAARKQSYPINTFVVPDDDDDSDVVEVVDDSVLARPMSPQDHESGDSDQSVDAENHGTRESSTPITSPSTKEVSVGFEPKPTEAPLKEVHSNPSNGTSGSPIVVDGDEAPVTPRMTPPPIPDASNGHVTNVDIDADAMDHDSDHSSSVASSPREPQPATEFDYWDEEDVISYGFGSESESSNDESSDSEMDCESEDATSHGDELDNKHQPQTGNETQVANEERGKFGAPASTIQPQNIQPQNTEEAQFNFDKAWPTTTFARSGPLSPAMLCDPYAIPRSSLQQTGNSYPRLPSLHALSSSGWEPQAVPQCDHFDIGTAPRAFGQRCTRFDALPVRRQPRQTVLSAPVIPPVVPSSYNGSSGVCPVKNDIYNAEDQWQVEKSSFPDQSRMQRTTSADYSREPNTRLCISDIVDNRLQEARPVQGLPPKRKADEMEPVAMPQAPPYPDEFAGHSSVDAYASGANTVPLGTSERVINKESFSQDAQLRPLLPDLDDSTQHTGLYSIPEDRPEESKSVPNVERPSKRLKTSDEGRGRFVAHAATALAGAVAGGLGTIALLASLPPDYFV